MSNNPKYWQNKWDTNDIGFHKQQTNQYLVELFPTLHLPPQSRVLVPLCGKSLDMIWLIEHGYHVVGIELSEIAVKAFFEEHNFSYTCELHGNITKYSHPNVTIYQGDLFNLSAQEIEPCQGYYDRGALIALPESIRSAYVDKISTLLAANAKGLVLTYEYDWLEIIGPPYSVPKQEVMALYHQFDVQEVMHQTQNPLSQTLFKKGLRAAMDYGFIVTLQ